MKRKKVLLTWMIGINLLATFILPPAFAKLQALSPLEYVLEYTDSPESLSRFMKQNFDFTEDKSLFGEVDYWQTPEEFWNRKKGDCEDYALFANYVFARLQMESYVISIYGPDGYGHTIVIYKEGGRFQVMNEDRIYRYDASSIEEAISFVHSDWSWAAIAERADTRGRAVQTFFNI